MSLSRLSVAATLLTLLAAGLALSGCGRRGALEPPPSARVLTTDEQGNVVKTDETDQTVNRPFILDGLIE